MLNDVTEPGLADVDPARSIWLAKPYGNDNLLWLSSQVRLLFRFTFESILVA